MAGLNRIGPSSKVVDNTQLCGNNTVNTAACAGSLILQRPAQAKERGRGARLKWNWNALHVVLPFGSFIEPNDDRKLCRPQCVSFSYFFGELYLHGHIIRFAYFIISTVFVYGHETAF